MKIKLTLLSVMFLTLSSCWSPDFIENNKVTLDLGKQQLIPYQQGQKINFIHTKGYAFDFKVVAETLDWTHDRFNYQTNLTRVYYTSYQEKKVVLKSDYPDVSITLSINPNPIYGDVINVDMNSRYTKIPFDKNYKFVGDIAGGTSVVHDTIVINGKTYNDVIEAQFGNSAGSYKSILYNALGVLQIKISDDEAFSTNN